VVGIVAPDLELPGDVGPAAAQRAQGVPKEQDEAVEARLFG